LVRVTVWVALLVPVICGAKLSDEGARLSVAGDAPMPVKAAVSVPAEEAIEKVPLRVPRAVGLKTTATVQLVEGASVLVQVFAEIMKSPEMAATESGVETAPVFETTMY
jgi:hypothetical protein